MERTHAAHGAYGLRVEGLEGAEELLLPVSPDWPLLTIRWLGEPLEPAEEPETATETEATISFGPRRAVITRGSSGRIDIERDPTVATFRIPRVRDPHALVHPYLGAAASVASLWLGREVFHAGAFLGPSGAWLVLGSRTAGKSSLLASLHAQGCEVLADDVVVVEQGQAFAAPRALDLRQESAEQLQLGEPLGRVGDRDRWRVRLGRVPLAAPLVGAVFLSWFDTLEVVEVSGSARLPRLVESLTLPGRPADALALLELASLPCLELRRPRAWGALDAASDAILAATGR